MSRLQFCVLTGLSLLSAALILFETYSAGKLEEVNALQEQAQRPILQAQAMQPLAREMVQRTAAASGRDPALAELLAKYGLVLAPPTTQPAANPMVTAVAPSPVEK